MMPQQQKPSHRSLIGMLGLILGLTLYAFLAAAIGDLMVEWPMAVQMIYYLIAGLIWLIPAKKVIYWMGGQ